jgi:hypothetical protein
MNQISHFGLGLHIFALGLFAGQATVFSYGTRRVVNSSNRPRDTWIALYDTTKNIAVPCVFSGIFSGAINFYFSRDQWILASTALIALMPFWTFVIMKSSTHTIHVSGNESEDLSKSISSWLNLHHYRTVVGWAALISALVSVSK